MQIPPEILAAETWQFDAAGIIARFWRVPYGSVAVTSYSTAPIVVSSSPMAVAPPSGGPGVAVVAAGAAEVCNVAGRALTLYGNPGDTVCIEVYRGSAAPAWRRSGATPPPPQNISLFTDQVPTSLDAADSVSGTLGLALLTDVPGLVTSIRYYKGNASWDGQAIYAAVFDLAGNQIGAGNRVQQVADAPGWLDIVLATPVPVTAGQTFVPAYQYFGTSHYVVTENFFTVDLNNGPLHAMATAIDGHGNGRFVQPSTYTTPNFPVSVFAASNYFVDVVMAI